MKRLALAAVLGWLAAAASADAQNPNPITIPESGPASPYPGVIDVTDSTRIIEDVDVRLNDLAHELPDELEVALVGPDGTTVMLMSDVGSAPVTSCLPDLQFSSEATGPVPDDPLLCSGVYQPTDDDSDEFDLDVFPDPGPAGATGGSLTPFNGQNYFGAWRLFVVDDTPGDGGSIASWDVRFNTRQLGLTRQGSPPASSRTERRRHPVRHSPERRHRHRPVERGHRGLGGAGLSAAAARARSAAARHGRLGLPSRRRNRGARGRADGRDR